ncbi:MAG: DegT/DnrJ/EryC1/StrS family aminotransferase [Candidatus Tectomicrobia bacterium]|uniref:DegT/DnrJ/EryC1/StrS family aminotransferase n=1 Tax=Tectimicrobiota bacterium TaxID=2528274 RepID=A0A932FX66_UNCTE|nr:DegT/DnrJ/EryC1/StrS family aminotransferase [Candidatus Tectomicrobia bacterium]
MELIPHSRPTLGEEEIEAVSRVIRSGRIAQGEEVSRFEQEMAQRLGVGGGVAVSSGTAALHLSLLALEVGPGNEVILPDYVCLSVLDAVRQVGATPVLADIDPVGYNLAAPGLSQQVTPRTRAIIVPHLFGLPADLAELLSLGIPVIEDCAQALGARYQDRPVGSFGQLAVLSFYATKVIATGEGGMVLSPSAALLERVRDLRGYQDQDDDRVRYNYKMTDLQAALGRVQLRRLDAFLSRRRAIARRYTEALAPLGVTLPWEDPSRQPIHHRYVIGLREEGSTGPLRGEESPGENAGSPPAKVERFLAACLQQGVCCCRPVYRPLHYYLSVPALPHSAEAWRRNVSLPIYPLLEEAQVDRVIQVVKETLAP